MDKTLLNNFAHAVRARPLLKLLPAGLREYCLQYEQMCLEDIRAQTGNLVLTEAEALAMTPTTTSKIITASLPVAGEIALALAKKYAPTIAASGTIGAVIGAALAPYLNILTK